MCKFCTYHILCWFAAIKDVIEVFANNCTIDVEQFSHLPLGHPHCLLEDFYFGLWAVTLFAV